MRENLSVILENELKYDHLKSLINQEIIAIRIPNYYPVELCDIYSFAINNFLKEQSQTIGDGIYKSTTPSFWEARNKPEIFESYFTNAIPNIRRMRGISSNMSPIDKFRLELDEVWPAGATLLRINHRPMFFGIVRSWKGEAKPHLDDLESEIPGYEEVKGETSQFGVNIYLNVPTTGGEIILWDRTFSTSESESLGVEGNYGYGLNTLPSESLTIKPQKGDLILLNSKKIHSVKESLEGERLTVSGFVGHWSESKPLCFWS